MLKNIGKFPQRLKALREKKRISKSVLSQICGLSSDSVRRYECGEDEPRLTALKALADFFDVSVDYLIGRDGEE